MPEAWRPWTNPRPSPAIARLAIEEPLIFEIGCRNIGVDSKTHPPLPRGDRGRASGRLPCPRERLGKIRARLGGLERREPIGLPGLSEPEAVRHYVRLSQKNYSIDTGIFPLGSCTMKHNPRLNEKMARLPGFADIHPLQPEKTVQGALALMEELSRWLLELTGMKAVALSPKAGAHGELCGMVAIRAALEARGEAGTRRVVLVPELRPWHQPRHGRASRLHGPRRARPRGRNGER